MRIQPWMTAVAGAVTLLANQSPVSGQTPDYSGADFYAAGPGNAYPVPPAPAAGSYVDPNLIYAPGTPESFQPWPQISPFQPGNVGQDQFANQGGLWFRDILHRRRTYEASIEALVLWYADAGNATIGSPYAQPGNYGGISNPQGVPMPGYAGLYPVVGSSPATIGWYDVTNKIYPYPALSTTAGTYVIQDERSYPIRTAGHLPDPSTTAGIKGNLGFFNEDDTGVMATAWWGGEASSEFVRGADVINGIPVTRSMINTLAGQNLTPRNGVIPLYNGEPGLFGDGSTAKYDVLFQMRNTVEAAGANFSLYQQPLYKNGGIKVRPLWGLRYQYIGEGFHFKGVDSGFNYELTGVTTGGTTGSTTGTTYTGRPVSTTMVALYNQYEARLNNTVQSHIAGPEIGLRFDLGENSSGFKIWGETNLGLAVNSEEIHLWGDNIGDPLFDARLNGNTPPRMLDPANDSTFNSKVNSAHVSPMFQQSVFADMDLLSAIPVIRKMPLFEYATFRFGYTFTWVGEVSRPAETINWQGFPLYPEIKRTRSGWHANQLNFALDWKY